MCTYVLYVVMYNHRTDCGNNIRIACQIKDFWYLILPVCGFLIKYKNTINGVLVLIGEWCLVLI